MFTIFKYITTISLWIHAGAAITSLIGFQWIKSILDASYAASGHPVDYATGQTTFNAEMIKGYYAHMENLGTLEVYQTTQIIDFGFILAMACMGLFFCTLLARFSRADSWGRRIGLFAGLSLCAGAFSDTIENGISFIMLANPVDFAAWLALPYSAFASLKFALITVGMLAVVVSFLMGGIGRLFKKPRIG